MKSVYIILASMLFFLAVKPCSDDGIEQFESVIEMVCHLDDHAGDHQHTSSHDHDHEEGADDCSPFCSCACCGSHMEEAFEFPSFLVIYLSPQIHNSLYYNNFIGGHIGDRFQPPRV